MDKRLTVPELKVHNPEWYKDKIYINSYRWWEQNEARLVAKGPAGKALVALAKRFYSVTGSQQ